MLRYPALLLAVLSFAPTHAVAQDKATVQSLNEKFAASFNAGDFSAVAGHYTEDAFLLPPGAKIMQGRSAI
jgi:ketosteroid isomerase-like protein